MLKNAQGPDYKPADSEIPQLCQDGFVEFIKINSSAGRIITNFKNFLFENSQSQPVFIPMPLNGGPL
jgi:hypothetical protein